jgi:hypothetical protein
MEIKIKKIGYKVGTVGWFAAGIADGSIKIREAVSKSKKHALYLEAEEKSWCIAIYNPYGCFNSELADSEEYKALDMDWNGADPGTCDCSLPLTEACKETIHEIAEAWCEVKNAERAQDKKVKITIKFEEAA